jgi:hypothetical protein
MPEECGILEAFRIGSDASENLMILDQSRITSRKSSIDLQPPRISTVAS